MTIVERIFDELSKKNIKQNAFADIIGENAKTVSSWKTTNTLIKAAERFSNISDYFGWSLDYLFTGKENSPSELSEDEHELMSLYKDLSNKNQACVLERARTLHEIELEEKKPRIFPEKRRRRYIDIADMAAGAGISVPFSEDDAFTKLSFPESDIPDNADCGIPINGDSMEPEYPDGCIVWVSKTAPIKYGDTIIAIVNGEPFCKIYQRDGLHSFNSAYDVIKIYDSMSFKLFGKVIGYYCENTNE